MKRYEGMFLFDSGVVHEWSAVENEVRRLCERVGAELLACVKYDDRRLAYEIRHRKRGTYVLTYFDASPERIADLERDARLSDLVLRILILRAEHVPQARIEELRALPAGTALSPSSEGRRYGDDFRPRRERGPRTSFVASESESKQEQTPSDEETESPHAEKSRRAPQTLHAGDALE